MKTKKIKLTINRLGVETHKLMRKMSEIEATNYSVAEKYLSDEVQRIDKLIMDRVCYSTGLNIRELLEQDSLSYRRDVLISKELWLLTKLKYLRQEINRVVGDVSDNADFGTVRLEKETERIVEILDKLISNLEPVKEQVIRIPVDKDTCLNRGKLAQRLNVSPSLITLHKKDQDFPEWSQKRDPENIAWEYKEKSPCNSFDHFKPILKSD